MINLNSAIKLLITFSALLICLGSFTAVKSYADSVLHIATGEYPPWTGKELKQGGFVNHVITEVFRRQGYQVRFSYLPWKRSYENAKQGQFDAASYWHESPVRKQDFLYSEPLSSEKLVFFHLKSKNIPNWQNLADLKNYSIGATRGYTYTQDFWNAADSKLINVQVVTSDLQNLRKLLKGRIDLFPTSMVNGYNLIYSEFDPSTAQLFTFHPKLIAETRGHLLFPKDLTRSPELLQIFNRGLAKFKRSKLYTTLVQDLLSGAYNK